MAISVPRSHIQDAVEECAAELSFVNSTLQDGLDRQLSQAVIEGALEKSETIETKVQRCADELTHVNQALEEEVHKRQLLENQLGAAREQEEATRHAAFHDALTALPNRVLFNDRLEHVLAQARRHRWMVGVLFIDLDSFKPINDIHGHAVGDQVLQIIAGRLKGMVRHEDTVSRQGGDEFLYLLMELAQPADAAVVAIKIIRLLSEPCDVATELGGELRVRPSIGIAIFPKDGDTANVLSRRADRAMYRAKRDKSGYAYAEVSDAETVTA
ncbi:MAG: diguanylate cyclase [Rhodanobacter sp.]